MLNAFPLLSDISTPSLQVVIGLATIIKLDINVRGYTILDPYSQVASR